MRTTRSLAVALAVLALAGVGCSNDDDGPVVPLPDTTAPSASTDLAMSILSTCAAALQWTAPGDDGATGTAAAYEVR